jgi:hypothetical protein
MGFKIYKTIILTVILYGHEHWYLILGEEHWHGAEENSWLKQDEVTEIWRKLHKENPNNTAHYQLLLELSNQGG